MLGYWDTRLSTRMTEGDEPGGGGGSGGNSPPAPQKPWASEFGDTFDGDKAWELITKLRSNERGLTRERDTFKKKIDEFESAGATELEKANKKLADLEAANNELTSRLRRGAVQSAVAAEAEKAGAVYPLDIFRLLDDSEFEIDDDGSVKNAAKLVSKLKESRPALFKAGPSVDGNKGRNGGAGNESRNDDWLRSAFRPSVR